MRSTGCVVVSSGCRARRTRRTRTRRTRARCSHSRDVVPVCSPALETVRLLHRICRVYAGVGIAVPAFGIATTTSMGVMGDTWLIVSMALTVAAAIVLVVLVLPRQESVQETLLEGAASRADRATTATTATTVQLAMFTGVFNLPWATMTILMILRPGSTTAA
ncbi:protease [Streptomyces sp. QTS52]